MRRVPTTILLTAASLAVPMTLLAKDEPPQPWTPGIESPGYVWNEMRGEKLIALQAQGDPLRGELSFDVCLGCHEANAVGEPDGSYPRLAGQHATVLIKQLTDVRAGQRDNRKMYPYAADHVLTPQEIADIAVYLQTLPVPADNGKGPGSALERGQSIYQSECETCHGPGGLGDAKEFYPRVSGQHYEYLLREVKLIRDGERRNANPEMVKAVKPLSDEDLRAVSDYMSRFPVSGG